MLTVEMLSKIPHHARLVIRCFDGVDAYSGRMQFRDYIGHIAAYDDTHISFLRDATANGLRPEEMVSIPLDAVARIKPIPERPVMSPHN
ncbi:DUF6725 family protein [Alloscardovia criceti]|uniref:DUF6725 family protein n=1 Tax=Alloscardovia criceti TaxID=356828 RepID=UPI000365B30F|nr:DUF6725 family protein [Alloscardovia criceti]